VDLEWTRERLGEQHGSRHSGCRCLLVLRIGSRAGARFSDVHKLPLLHHPHLSALCSIIRVPGAYITNTSMLPSLHSMSVSTASPSHIVMMKSRSGSDI
jgi:hypothetical protein